MAVGLEQIWVGKYSCHDLYPESLSISRLPRSPDLRFNGFLCLLTGVNSGDGL